MSLKDDFFNEEFDAKAEREVFGALVEQIEAESGVRTATSVNNALTMYRNEITREYMKDNLFSPYITGIGISKVEFDQVSDGIKTLSIPPKDFFKAPKKQKRKEEFGRDLIFED